LRAILDVANLANCRLPEVRGSHQTSSLIRISVSPLLRVVQFPPPTPFAKQSTSYRNDPLSGAGERVEGPTFDLDS